MNQIQTLEEKDILLMLGDVYGKASIQPVQLTLNKSLPGLADVSLDHVRGAMIELGIISRAEKKGFYTWTCKDAPSLQMAGLVKKQAFILMDEHNERAASYIRERRRQKSEAKPKAASIEDIPSQALADELRRRGFELTATKTEVITL